MIFFSVCLKVKHLLHAVSDVHFIVIEKWSSDSFGEPKVEAIATFLWLSCSSLDLAYNISWWTCTSVPTFLCFEMSSVNDWTEQEACIHVAYCNTFLMTFISWLQHFLFFFPQRTFREIMFLQVTTVILFQSNNNPSLPNFYHNWPKHW